MRRVERAFGELDGSAPSGRRRAAGRRPHAAAERLVIPMMNKAQTDIAYGFTTISRLDPAYYAYWLMNNILGQYALGGRLGDSIRERQGMAYYVFSALRSRTSALGRWSSAPASIRRTSIERSPRSTRSSAQLGRGRTDRARGAGVEASILIGSMPRTLETNLGIATFLQTSEFFGLGLDYDRAPAGSPRGGHPRRRHVTPRARVLDPERAAVVGRRPVRRPAPMTSALSAPFSSTSTSR